MDIRLSLCVVTYAGDLWYSILLFPESSLADEWLRWLRDGHVAEVLAGGATHAKIVELDSAGAGRSFEVRYRFPSREAFDC